MRLKKELSDVLVQLEVRTLELNCAEEDVRVRVEKETSSFDAELTKMQQRVAELELEVSGSAGELLKNAVTVSEKSDQLDLLESENIALKHEIENLKACISGLEAAAAIASHQRTAEVDQKIAEMSQRLAVAELAHVSLQSELDDKTSALEEAKAIATELEIDNMTLTNTIRDLKASLQTQAQQAEETTTTGEALTTPRKVARRHSRTSEGDSLCVVGIRRENSMAESPGVSLSESKLSRAHSSVTVAALPAGKYTLPASVEESMAALRQQQKVHERFLLDPVGSVQVSAMNALQSNDLEVLKKEVEDLLNRFVGMKATNAALLQKMQAMKGNIQVCCRARPPLEQELQNNARVCVDTSSDNELAWFDKRAGLWKSFAFDRVWPMDAMQADIFADVEPLALSVVDGFNACILAFGQTGSGKTWTMNGYGDEYGVSYRTLHKIFELLYFKRSQHIIDRDRVKALRSRRASTAGSIDGAGDVTVTGSDDMQADSDDDDAAPEYNFSVSVAMLEIYNEMVRDLLSPAASGHEGHGLDIRQTSEGGIGVPGLTNETVTGIDDVMRVFARGSANRATMTTNLNEHSSRSHSILMVDVTTFVKGGAPVSGKLYLVDLAGSERVEKSGVTGIAMKEAQHINKSLSALGDVMEALDSKAKHVPYRNSKLTYLLQDSLGGSARTMMIVTICPTEESSDETLFALQFATRVRRIQLGAAQKNVASKNLEETVKNLKLELKEVKRKKSKIEESINDVKKEQKRNTDKATNHLETKLRALEDMKKSADLQVTTLQKANADMATKLQDERSDRASIAHDLEIANKTLKKTNEQIRVLTREKEQAFEKLKEKERELSIRSMSETLSEKKAGTTVTKPGVSRLKKPPTLTSSAPKPSSDASVPACEKDNSIEFDGVPATETTRRSPSGDSSPNTRLIKEERCSDKKSSPEREPVENDDSFTGSPPPKKSTNIPRVPMRRPSDHSVDTVATGITSTSQHIPRYTFF